MFFQDEDRVRRFSRQEPLKWQEQAILIRKAKEGDRRARDRLLTSNLRLVVSIAKQYQGKLPIEDCIQLGCLGLIRAFEKFDLERGSRFSTYASWWINQSISRGVKNLGSLVRIPIHLQWKRKRGDPIENIDDIKIFDYIYSLDAPVFREDEEESETLGERVASYQNPVDYVEFDIAMERIQKLPEMERRSIEAYYLEGKTINEISSELAIPRERVRRLIESGIRKVSMMTLGS